jgi:hypothetical protein
MARAKERTLRYPGELNGSAQARRLKTIEVFNERGEAEQLKLFPSQVESPDDPQVARALSHEVRLERTRQFGTCRLGLELWKRLGLDRFFEECLGAQFIEALPFTYLHVFTYSERPGTPATASADSVPIAVRKERNHVLRDLAEAKNRSFRERMAGLTLSAVTLHEPGTALTGNYLKVALAREREPNAIVDLRIGGVTGLGSAKSRGSLAFQPNFGPPAASFRSK